jgi:hypothetical protein
VPPSTAASTARRSSSLRDSVESADDEPPSAPPALMIGRRRPGTSTIAALASEFARLQFCRRLAASGVVILSAAREEIAEEEVARRVRAHSRHVQLYMTQLQAFHILCAETVRAARGRPRGTGPIFEPSLSSLPSLLAPSHVSTSTIAIDCTRHIRAVLPRADMPPPVAHTSSPPRLPLFFIAPTRPRWYRLASPSLASACRSDLFSFSNSCRRAICPSPLRYRCQ